MSTYIPTTTLTPVAATVETTTLSSTTSFYPTALSLRLRRRTLSSSSSLSTLRLSSQSTQQSIRTGVIAVTAQLNNASTGGSSSGAVPKQEIKNDKPSESVPMQASEESISEFIAQVASLVKLVDSRDIVELQMKQHGCELLIRKKEAMTQASPAPMVMMQSPSPQTASTPHVSAPVAAPPAPPARAPSVPKPATSSLPSIKSPMAGTLYRCPSPGAPPFIEVGDKVQKGQVLCIIEAMKLMNEIEADQSGTIVEALAEDGKPVSLDTPLFAIQP